MIKGLRLKKNAKPPSKKMIAGVVFSVFILVAAFIGAGWYYFIYQPALAVAEAKRLENEKLQHDIKAVDTFYLSSLTGGGIPQFVMLLTEIVNSYELIKKFSYIKENYTCNAKGCTFNYQLDKNGTFLVIDKIFWGETYKSSFSDKGFDFKNLKSGLDKNNLLTAYKANRKITVGLCNDVLSYLYSYNSIVSADWRIIVESAKESKVATLEKTLSKGGKIKFHGLNFIKWSMKYPKMEPDDDRKLLYLASLFDRQAYKESFIIQKIDTFKEKKISGVIVCISGV